MSAYQVRRLTADEVSAWDRWVGEAPAGRLYHRTAWLKALAREVGFELQCLVCEFGGSVVGLLPVFVKTKAVTVVMSPPPRSLLPDMGLVLLGKAARNAGRNSWQVARAFQRFLEKQLKPDILRLKMSHDLPDIRSYQWDGYKVLPRFTYLVPLEHDDPCLRLHKQVRTDARRAEKYAEIAIHDGENACLSQVVALVRDRYREQRMPLLVSDRYIQEVTEQLAEGQLKVKVATERGRVLTGLVLLDGGRIVQHWMGGTKYSEGYIGLNELLHRKVIEEAASAGRQYYELVGGNTERLARHKERLGGALKTRFDVEGMSLSGRVMSGIAQSLDRWRRRSTGYVPCLRAREGRLVDRGRG